MAFSHVALSSPDPVAVEKFYTKHFGFVRARYIPLGDTAIVFLKNPEGVYLELFQSDAELPAPKVDTGDGPHYSAIRHIAFQVESVDAVLTAMGDEAVVTLGPLDFSGFIPGWYTAWVKDPDGNIVEISQGYTDEENPPVLEG